MAKSKLKVLSRAFDSGNICELGLAGPLDDYGIMVGTEVTLTKVEPDGEEPKPKGVDGVEMTVECVSHYGDYGDDPGGFSSVSCHGHGWAALKQGDKVRVTKVEKPKVMDVGKLYHADGMWLMRQGPLRCEYSKFRDLEERTSGNCSPRRTAVDGESLSIVDPEVPLREGQKLWISGIGDVVVTDVNEDGTSCNFSYEEDGEGRP
jgi:hypothetical protein